MPVTQELIMLKVMCLIFTDDDATFDANWMPNLCVC
jgi:hypothetical protein